jgi:hypothetical protein
MQKRGLELMGASGLPTILETCSHDLLVGSVSPQWLKPDPGERRETFNSQLTLAVVRTGRVSFCLSADDSLRDPCVHET